MCARSGFAVTLIALATPNGTQGFRPSLSFSRAVNVAVGRDPLSVAVGDLDHDGRADLAVANNEGHDVSVLLATGPTSFRRAQSVRVGEFPYAVVIADFNSDTQPDLVVAGDSNASVLLGDGGSRFHATPQIGEGAFGSVVTQDFNRDGKLDLAFPDSSHPETSPDTLEVHLGEGGGSFGGSLVSPIAGGGQANLAAADLNRDGSLDLVTPYFFGAQIGVQVLMGDGTGHFAAPVQHRSSANGVAVGVAVGDLNDDGLSDVALADLTGVSVFLGDGRGGFRTPVRRFPVGRLSSGVVLADLNGDSAADLAISDSLDNKVRVLAGDGKGGFSRALAAPTGEDATSVAVGDLNLDGRPDLAVTNGGPDDVSVLLNRTDGRGGRVSCVSRRRLRIHVRSPDGSRLASARVTFNRRRIPVIRRGGRLTVDVDLRGLPTGAFAAAIVVRTANHHSFHRRRTYRTCTLRHRSLVLPHL